MRTKYNAKKVIINGIKFDSKAEGERYLVLKERVKNGEIEGLLLQPIYQLQPSFKDDSGRNNRAISYRADFFYIEAGKMIVEDVKGMMTPEYKIKAKLFRFKYPFLTHLETFKNKKTGAKK